MMNHGKKGIAFSTQRIQLLWRNHTLVGMLLLLLFIIIFFFILLLLFIIFIFLLLSPGRDIDGSSRVGKQGGIQKRIEGPAPGRGVGPGERRRDVRVNRRRRETVTTARLRSSGGKGIYHRHKGQIHSRCQVNNVSIEWLEEPFFFFFFLSLLLLSLLLLLLLLLFFLLLLLL